MDIPAHFTGPDGLHSLLSPPERGSKRICFRSLIYHDRKSSFLRQMLNRWLGRRAERGKENILEMIPKTELSVTQSDLFRGGHTAQLQGVSCHCSLDKCHPLESAKHSELTTQESNSLWQLSKCPLGDNSLTVHLANSHILIQTIRSLGFNNLVSRILKIFSSKSIQYFFEEKQFSFSGLSTLIKEEEGVCVCALWQVIKVTGIWEEAES